MLWRKVGWFVLLLGGATALVWSAVKFEDKGAAIAAGVISVVAWSAYGALTNYFLGLKRKILRHLRTTAKKTAVVTHAIPVRDRVDIQVALDQVREVNTPHAPICGTGLRLLTALVQRSHEPEPIQWELLSKSLTETHPCVASPALYFLRRDDGRPFCAQIQPDKLEVMAPTRCDAEVSLDHVLRLARERSVFRGSVVSLERVKGGGYTVKFHDMPAAPRDAIVLPPDVMDVVERNVLGLLKHGDVLRRSGRSTRHGVLLYGPPGTGKTLVTRYLVNACADYTVILLTGRQLAMIRESCQLAKLLAPSMVVLEDVDLVAVERGRNRHNRVLHELLDEMDGLGAKNDCMFLLTTNRPDVLEPALAARPGRVDQAIYFPLPDLDCRRKLFARFAAGLDMSAVSVAPLLDRTEGASPAFIQELFRKAALMAAERGQRDVPLSVTNADFDRAIRELLEFGGDLTRSLLGFKAAR